MGVGTLEKSRRDSKVVYDRMCQGGILSDGMGFSIWFVVLVVLVVFVILTIQQRSLLLNTSHKVKAEASIQPIKVVCNLTIIILVVPCLSWDLDFLDMCVFCDVGCPLYNCSRMTDAGDHTLEKLQLRDLPVIM